MKNKKLAFFLLICFLILLIVNVYVGYSQKNYNYWSIGSNLLFILVMAIVHFQQKKER